MATDYRLLDDKTIGFKKEKFVSNGRSKELTVAGFRVRTSDLVKILNGESGPTPGGYDNVKLRVCADTIIADHTFPITSNNIIFFARRLEVESKWGVLVSSPRIAWGPQPLLPWFRYSFIIGQPQDKKIDVAHWGVPAPFIPPSIYPVYCGSTPIYDWRVGKQFGDQPILQVKQDNVTPDTWHELDGFYISSLRASLVAGMWLVESADPEDQGTGWQMLEWVAACARHLGMQPPSDAPEVRNAILELLQSAGGYLIRRIVAATSTARYVPVLSPSAYRERANAQMKALKAYEDEWRRLDTAVQIGDLAGEVTNILTHQSAVEKAALTYELEKIRKDLKDLSNAGTQIGKQSADEYKTFKKCHEDLKGAIGDAMLKQAVEGLFEFLGNSFDAVTGLVGNLMGDLSSIGDTVDSLGKTGTSFAGFIDKITTQFPEDDLKRIRSAKTVVDLQRSAARTFLVARHASDSPNSQQPELPSVATTLDVAWKTYQTDATLWLKGLKDRFGGDVAGAADLLQASLDKLVIYGQAINEKVVACAVLLGRGAVVNVRLNGAGAVTGMWQTLLGENADANARRRMARWLLGWRVDAIKYSLLSTWFDYRNSVFYHGFRAPPVKIDMTMDYAALSQATEQMLTWMQDAVAGTIISGTDYLLTDNSQVSLTFDVVRAGTAKDGKAAIYTPATAEKNASIVWTIPLGFPQLHQHIAGKGYVGVWIKSAKFFMDGVTANESGVVLVNVSTSGSYANGVKDSAFSFETFGLTRDYRYAPPDNVLTEWEIDTGVVMKPALFTQWRMEFARNGGDPSKVTKLTMKMNVTYLRSREMRLEGEAADPV